MSNPSIENGISLVVATWNNLDYLRVMINSLNAHSTYPHQLLVHVNEGTDETLDFLDDQDIPYSHSETNIGLCTAANLAAENVQKDWVMCFDDDMYFLPGWDVALHEFYREFSFGDKVWLNLVMIEPAGGAHSIVRNYGTHPANFHPNLLASHLPSLRGTKPLINSTHGPMIIPTSMWRAVGGYSEEFNPGIGSEDELGKKCWDYGCRNFVNVPESLIYHFTSTTTNKLDRQALAEKRESEFLRIHGVRLGEWQRDTLRRGAPWTFHG